MNGLAQPYPVFIVGPVRSGSTLLRLMLDSHPQITNPGECDFLFDMVGDTGECPNVSDYAEWLSANRIFRATGLLVDAKLSYEELMRSFLSQFGSNGALLTMNVHRHFHRIPYLFPEARYVRLLRDPRDVARSCIAMGWVGHVYYGVDIWESAERSWQDLRKRLAADQYMEIKYEELVNDIEAALSTICDFLGIRYSSEMMNYAAKSSYALPDRNLSYQWRRKYTMRELQLVESKIGSQIARLGYALSGHNPSGPKWWEKISLYLHNKKHRVLHQVKRYGVRLYMEQLVASRFGSREWRYACQRKLNRIDVEHLK